jgi:hypothetical protein
MSLGDLKSLGVTLGVKIKVGGTRGIITLGPSTDHNNGNDA